MQHKSKVMSVVELHRSMGAKWKKKQSKIDSSVGPNNGRFSIKFSTKYGLHTLFDTIDAFLIAWIAIFTYYFG